MTTFNIILTIYLLLGVILGLAEFKTQIQQQIKKDHRVKNNFVAYGLVLIFTMLVMIPLWPVYVLENIIKKMRLKNHE